MFAEFAERVLSTSSCKLINFGPRSYDARSAVHYLLSSHRPSRQCTVRRAFWRCYYDLRYALAFDKLAPLCLADHLAKIYQHARQVYWALGCAECDLILWHFLQALHVNSWRARRIEVEMVVAEQYVPVVQALDDQLAVFEEWLDACSSAETVHGQMLNSSFDSVKLLSSLVGAEQLFNSSCLSLIAFNLPV